MNSVNLLNATVKVKQLAICKIYSNGIGDRQGQALFLAFAQHDPDEVAEQTAKWSDTYKTSNANWDVLTVNMRFIR